jgi:peroxiredoxin
MSPTVGEPAPEFTLRDQHGTALSLAALRGPGAVLLVFYPFAFSGVCTRELHELRDRLPELEALGASVVGLSCDPMYALRTYADRDGLTFPLLSDFWPHGSTAAAYGVLDQDRGCPRRSSFLIGRDGVLRWRLHHPMGEARPVDGYLGALSRLPAVEDPK